MRVEPTSELLLFQYASHKTAINVNDYDAELFKAVIVHNGH
jgi:hypothetical protein